MWIPKEFPTVIVVLDFHVKSSFQNHEHELLKTLELRRKWSFNLFDKHFVE